MTDDKQYTSRMAQPMPPSSAARVVTVYEASSPSPNDVEARPVSGPNGISERQRVLNSVTWSIICVLAAVDVLLFQHIGVAVSALNGFSGAAGPRLALSN